MKKMKTKERRKKVSRKTTRTFYTIILAVFIIFALARYFDLGITGFITQTTGGTTTNVTVQGVVGAIDVLNGPVNFTERLPGTACQPKAQAGGVAYINVSLNSTTNVNYDVYLSGTGLVGTNTGDSIPAGRIIFNDSNSTTCVDGTALSTSYVHDSDMENIPYATNVSIWFWINTTTGIVNDTYNGNLTIFVNATNGVNNETWFGENNLTVIIDKNIEVQWSLVPINFTSMSAGTTANATANQGNPSNFTIGANTNIYVDSYISGTNLNCTSGTCTPGTDFIGSGNVTFTNSSYYNETFRAMGSTYQGFPNWNNTGNTTDLFSYWNISIPLRQPPGGYGGDITGKAVDTGTAP